MFFELDDDQRALRQLAREVLADVSPLSRLRAVWADPGGELGEVWGKLATVGLTSIGIPVAAGGSGGGEVEAAVVLEGAGHVALPEPLVETLGVVVPTLRSHPSTTSAGWLARLATGDATVAVRLGPEPHALAGTHADAFLCEVDGHLHLVPRERVHTEPVGSVDPSRDLVTVVDVAVDGASRLEGADPRETWLRGAAATASALVGLAARLVDLTVAHARTREQFGVPIGSFQAVQQPLADVHVAVEAARTAHWYAAYTRATGAPDADAAARTAKVAASEACRLADQVALQVHAGIGFTWEHDLHLLLKRGAAWRAAYGDARTHRAVLADRLFGDPGTRR